jgi:hypothetical protein
MTTEKKADFARRLGINKSTITRAAQAGRIVLTADGLVEVEASLKLWHDTKGTRDDVAARHAHDRGAEVPAAQPETAIAAATPPGNAQPNSQQADNAGALGADEIGRRLRIATMLEREAKAEEAAMAVDKAAGLLVERSEVEFILRDFGSTLRGLIDSLPDRLTSEVCSKGGDVVAVHATIEQAAQQLLAEISGHMARRAQEAIGIAAAEQADA